jgi:hypothetical protein
MDMRGTSASLVAEDIDHYSDLYSGLVSADDDDEESGATTGNDDSEQTGEIYEGDSNVWSIN